MHQRSTLEIMVASVGGSGDASAFPPGVYYALVARVHHGGEMSETLIPPRSSLQEELVSTWSTAAAYPLLPPMPL